MQGKKGLGSTLGPSNQLLGTLKGVAEVCGVIYGHTRVCRVKDRWVSRAANLYGSKYPIIGSCEKGRGSRIDGFSLYRAKHPSAQ